MELMFILSNFLPFGPDWPRTRSLAGDRPAGVRILLSPPSGLTIVTILTFWLNRLGYPIQVSALPGVALLVIGSIAMTLIARPPRQ